MHFYTPFLAFVLFGMIASASPTIAWECPWPVNLSDLNSPMTPQSATHSLKNAEAQLLSIDERTDFDIELISQSIIQMETIGRTIQVDPETRSAALKAASGYYGRVADKYHSLKSGVCGRSSIVLLKKALEISPYNQSSIIWYSRLIEGLCVSTNKVPKFFIELNLKINLVDEAKLALRSLDRLQGPVASIPELNKRPVKSNLSKCIAGESLQTAAPVVHF